jgi:hypothetical protein
MLRTIVRAGEPHPGLLFPKANLQDTLQGNGVRAARDVFLAKSWK